ncbi:single-stranded-DNA-specific exonuclease RecJ [Deltaproteobacteria bacterium TL4]
MSFAKLFWKTADIAANKHHVSHLCQEFGITPILAQVLVARNLLDISVVENFLNPSVNQCHDPFLMHDMEHAMDRILYAIHRGEKIAIYGDYDVDGTAATVIVYKYLKRIGVRVYYFIPERMKDGYGLTEKTLRELKRKQVNIVITVDNGSTAVEEALLIKKMGMDLLITDHHRFGDKIPEAQAIVNPKHPRCLYPFKGLAGTGVAYKLLVALDQSLTEQNFWYRSGYIRPDLERDLDLVALATIADRVPLIDENRFFVQRGLQLLNHAPRPGIQALLKASNTHGKITTATVSFKLAPKINAVGRLSDPNTGVRLLLSRSLMEARPHAEALIEVNIERQRMERLALNSAILSASEQHDQKVIILISEHWHPGVIGNVATKIAGQFHKPTLAVTLSGNKIALGSVRSVGNFDICSVLERCSSFLEKFGGHTAAAGLSLQSQNLSLFCKKFQDMIEGGVDRTFLRDNDLIIEAWIHEKQLGSQFVEELIKMSPFGVDNPEPILGIHDAYLKAPSVFGNNHLKFFVNTTDADIEVVAWERSEWYKRISGYFDLVVSPQVMGPANQARIQFKALDIKST